MPIRHKTWDAPREPEDGFRLLICRYYPRGLRKEKKTWDHWEKNLGPSKELHADFYGKKTGMPINWETYRKRYLDQMKREPAVSLIAQLAQRVATGETITLLCSSACTNAAKCHRTLLKQLIEEMLPEAKSYSSDP